MNQPSLDILMKKADSRYTLVVATAKRARQITAGESSKLKHISNKPVTIALHEIGNDLITYQRLKSSQNK
ncbi:MULTISPECIES: DNA-directed RNA polymerase subunit omega [Carboxydothermus]|uniref:DNA-directed RNA polymerase subunit omega n=2 Tax=Carboxydothermus TaxID=129957 RepID=RPOZ_CARHZ|nr:MULTISPECIES: DNA-directed RNA polymerase subunit omega [Carboxydothermus]Q3AC15.1 RecName: Full=DNA-directed RNA polymerase subunit omega; Short=RNAP omega subunit; AltName: Full=RNA polymerase omega subunit; AltName: Full=Transcriptase subunit omega [Carboxydothermus hydrogenoformans Z-2901]ABB16246.1 DNA-directed RNA polymerase, omega subunit [Carboxydothermus hydrogenoformans Z-2901]NYE58257.1 DNA-directed RNA polymerase subunit omega [Carboxydothermus ferrireducens DSM 11255]